MEEGDKDSKLLLAAVAMLSDVSQGTESNQKSAVTPLSSKHKSKTASSTGSTASRNSAKKPTTLPNDTVEYLKAWMMSPEHIAHPYPTETEKAKIMNDTGLELKQLTNWFVNNRKRYWKPRVEAHLLKEQDVVTEVEAPSTPVGNDEICRKSPTLEVAKVTYTPSPVRISRRKGMKGKSHFIGGKANLPLVVVTPTSLMCTSKAHLISGHNSLASQSDGTTSCSDSDDDRCIEKASTPTRPKETIVQEKIDVHILRPSPSSSTVPDLKDVSVLANIPSERILKTFPECLLTFSSAAKKGTKSNLEGLRREAEIDRLKKRYWSMFLAERKCGTNTSTEDETDDSVRSSLSRPNDEIVTKRKHELHVIPSGCNDDHDTEATSYMLSPRPKYRRRSIDIWKEACQTANHVYDDDELPSLEEATRLFGYANRS